MNNDLGFGLALLKARDAANMIQVRMRAGDCLELEAVSINCVDDFFGVVTGIDANRAFGFLAANNASVLLESGDGDLFDDH
jgi:hypothetical protein